MQISRTSAKKTGLFLASKLIFDILAKKTAVFLDRNKKPLPKQWLEVSRRVILSTIPYGNGRSCSFLQDDNLFYKKESGSRDRTR